MKTTPVSRFNRPWLLLLASTILCLSLVSAADQESRSYRRTDKLDKVWLAEGFDFNGYDALLVEEATVDPSFKPKDDKESERLEAARGSLTRSLALSLESRKVNPDVTTKEADLQGKAKALKLKPVILKFSRGSSAARFGVGFGAGSPYIKVRLLVTDAASGKTLFDGELDEKADWFSSGYSSSRSLQSGATLELTEDAAEFMSRVARHEPIKYK